MILSRGREERKKGAGLWPEEEGKRGLPARLLCLD